MITIFYLLHHHPMMKSHRLLLLLPAPAVPLRDLRGRSISRTVRRVGHRLFGGAIGSCPYEVLLLKLVGGIPTPLKNMKVRGDDYS